MIIVLMPFLWSCLPSVQSNVEGLLFLCFHASWLSIIYIILSHVLELFFLDVKKKKNGKNKMQVWKILLNFNWNGLKGNFFALNGWGLKIIRQGNEFEFFMVHWARAIFLTEKLNILALFMFVYGKYINWNFSKSSNKVKSF